MSSNDASQWTSQQSSFRGVFSDDDSDETYNPHDWRIATEKFPNGIPRFVSLLSDFLPL
jgi:hypothetical protein